MFKRTNDGTVKIHGWYLDSIEEAWNTALEEAAMAAESLYDKEPSEDQDYGWNCACSRVAIAIRELKV